MSLLIVTRLGLHCHKLIIQLSSRAALHALTARASRAKQKQLSFEATLIGLL